MNLGYLKAELENLRNEIEDLDVYLMRLEDEFAYSFQEEIQEEIEGIETQLSEAYAEEMDLLSQIKTLEGKND